MALPQSTAATRLGGMVPRPAPQPRFCKAAPHAVGPELPDHKNHDQATVRDKPRNLPIAEMALRKASERHRRAAPPWTSIAFIVSHRPKLAFWRYSSSAVV